MQAPLRAVARRGGSRAQDDGWLAGAASRRLAGLRGAPGLPHASNTAQQSLRALGNRACRQRLQARPVGWAGGLAHLCRAYSAPHRTASSSSASQAVSTSTGCNRSQLEGEVQNGGHGNGLSYRGKNGFLQAHAPSRSCAAPMAFDHPPNSHTHKHTHLLVPCALPPWASRTTTWDITPQANPSWSSGRRLGLQGDGVAAAPRVAVTPLKLLPPPAEAPGSVGARPELLASSIVPAAGALQAPGGLRALGRPPSFRLPL